MTHEAPARPNDRGYNPAARAVETGSEWAKARSDAGLSIRDLESRTGINRGTLSLIEHGRLAPTLEQARRLLRAYDER